MATLSSTYPAIPYLFTSYELPPDAAAAAKHIAAPPMSSRHPVWKAVRASSAAALLLDEFKIGEERFQDGAAMANNPAMLAVQQVGRGGTKLDGVGWGLIGPGDAAFMGANCVQDC